MGNIVELKNKGGKVSFRARVRRKDQPVLTKTFHRRTDASNWIKRMEAEYLNGRSVPKSHRKTLRDAIARYKSDVVPHKKTSTQYSQAHILQFWESELGNRRMDEISYEHLQSARDRLLSEPLHRKGQKKPVIRGNAAVNRYFAVLRHLYSMAVRKWKWAHLNPLLELEPLPEPKGRTRTLSDQEFKELLEGVRNHPREDFRLIVHIALITGCRRGNAQSIHWEHIDFFQKTITFPDTKNNRPHVVPISEDLRQDLISYQKRIGRDSGPAFPSQPNSASPYVDIKQVWRKLIEALQLEDLHFHDLRHSVASFLAKQNASLIVIGRLLGHRSLESTKRYAHLEVSDITPFTEVLSKRMRK